MKTYVKHLGYKSHRGGKAAKGMRTIKMHIKYMENRPNNKGERVEREMFGRKGELSRQEFHDKLEEQPERGVIAHKLVISMDRKDFEEQEIDLKELTRETMSVWEQQTNRQYEWIACIHDKESNPHVHLVIAGRDQGGKEVVIKPHHLNQIKRAADNERQRLSERNMLRGKWLDMDFDLDKQLENERVLEFDFEQAIGGLDRSNGLAQRQQLKYKGNNIGYQIKHSLDELSKGGRPRGGLRARIRLNERGKERERDFDIGD